MINRTKGLWLLGLLIQLIGWPLHTQAQATTTNDPQKEKSLLWKVSGKQLKQPSFIFGTIHMICQDDYFFTYAMKQAFNQCHQLVLEVNMNDPALAMDLPQHMQLHEGKTIRDYFTDQDEYRQFAKRLKDSAQLDIEVFSHFKPVVLLSALTNKAFSCSQTSSYEMNLMNDAKKIEMPVAGLETALSQLDIFDSLSKEDVKNLLIQSLASNDDEKSVDEELVNLYKKQDIEGLQKLMESSKDLKGHEALLLTRRNQNWVTELPAMLDKQACFIAVGAAHLPGEQGILNLLRKQGYTVEAVH